MAEKLVFQYDQEGDILYINKCAPYAEQESEEIGAKRSLDWSLYTGQEVRIHRNLRHLKMTVCAKLPHPRWETSGLFIAEKKSPTVATRLGEAALGCIFLRVRLPWLGREDVITSPPKSQPDRLLRRKSQVMTGVGWLQTFSHYWRALPGTGNPLANAIPLVYSCPRGDSTYTCICSGCF